MAGALFIHAEFGLNELLFFLSLSLQLFSDDWTYWITIQVKEVVPSLPDLLFTAYNVRKDIFNALDD